MHCTDCEKKVGLPIFIEGECGLSADGNVHPTWMGFHILCSNCTGSPLDEYIVLNTKEEVALFILTRGDRGC